MSNSTKSCNHIIGLCDNDSYDGAGTPGLLKISGVHKALENGRGLVEYHAEREADPTYRNMDTEKYDSIMAAYDKTSKLSQLKKCTKVFSYCPICGTELSSILGGL